MENPKVAGSAEIDNTFPGEDRTFSLLRVFVMLVIAAIVGGAGYGIWAMNSPKGLAAYTGRVLYQGKPVVGSVMTQNLDDVFDSAGGNLDEDGRFTLDTNGEPGANVGRHKLAIVSFERGAPPRPLVPAAYTNIATTPLVIEVTGDPAMNKGEFILEGSAPEPAGGRPAPDSSPSAPSPSAPSPSAPSTSAPSTSPSAPDVSPPSVEPKKP